MSNSEDHRQFFPEDKFDRDRIVVDVPTTPPIPYMDGIPNGYDPMSRIRLEGRANRRMASGKTPWWVLICSWFITGILLFGTILPLLPMAGIEILFVAVVALLPLSILWRGTRAKLLAQQNRKSNSIRAISSD